MVHHRGEVLNDKLVELIEKVRFIRLHIFFSNALPPTPNLYPLFLLSFIHRLLD